jgi:hypothetical protein
MWPLWQSGQRIATETPLIGRVLRSRTAGRRERLAGENNRSDDESRALAGAGCCGKRSAARVYAQSFLTQDTSARVQPQRRKRGHVPPLSALRLAFCPQSRGAGPVIESPQLSPRRQSLQTLFEQSLIFIAKPDFSCRLFVHFLSRGTMDRTSSPRERLNMKVVKKLCITFFSFL